MSNEESINTKLLEALELAWQYIGCPPLIRPDYEEVVNEIQDALDEAHKLKHPDTCCCVQCLHPKKETK